MKFQERADFSFKKLPDTFVYFLCCKGEVIYIGKTTIGIVRPLSHKDKNFDEVKIIFANSEDEAYDLESFFIAKYTPKYNIVLPAYVSFEKAKMQIREMTLNKKYSITNLKKDISKYGIDVITLKNGSRYLKPSDLKELINKLSVQMG